VKAPRPVRLAGGITLDVWEEGPEQAPALLFLHGFPESGRAWRHQIAHLAGRYRCIAPDQRGYGGSSKPAAVADYALPALAGDVLALAEALGIARFALAGHDWGGMVAWAAAIADAARPVAERRIERLVIANAPHPWLFARLLWLDAQQRRASAYIPQLCSPAIDGVLATQGLGPVLLRAFGDGALAAMEVDERRALFARWADPAQALAMVNWYRASGVVVPPAEAPLALPADWQQPAAPTLGLPTLVLWGEADTALVPANLAGLADLCTDLAIERLPGVGHFSPWQAPAAVNAALDRFLLGG